MPYVLFNTQVVWSFSLYLYVGVTENGNMLVMKINPREMLIISLFLSREKVYLTILSLSLWLAICITWRVGVRVYVFL